MLEMDFLQHVRDWYGVIAVGLWVGGFVVWKLLSGTAQSTRLTFLLALVGATVLVCYWGLFTSGELRWRLVDTREVLMLHAVCEKYRPDGDVLTCDRSIQGDEFLAHLQKSDPAPPAELEVPIYGKPGAPIRYGIDAVQASNVELRVYGWSECSEDGLDRTKWYRVIAKVYRCTGDEP